MKILWPFEVNLFMLIRESLKFQDLGAASSVPRSVCRELVLTIVQHLPPSLVDQDTLPKVCVAVFFELGPSSMTSLSTDVSSY